MHTPMKAPMKSLDIFARYPVFTIEEFNKLIREDNPALSPRAVESLLAYHLKAGHIVRIRRGLYGSIPYTMKAETYPIDPYLIAAKVKPDAILAYHTALAFYGKTYSVSNTFTYLTERTIPTLQFADYEFKAVLIPASLRQQQQGNHGVKTYKKQNVDIKVTSYERTLVDVLDKPTLSGGWEEVWNSLETVEYFDLDKIVEYALLLNKRTTTALVGFYLEQHREDLSVTENILEILEQHKPKQAHYLNRQQESRLQLRWNLIVPRRILERNWEEDSAWS